MFSADRAREIVEEIGNPDYLKTLNQIKIEIGIDIKSAASKGDMSTYVEVSYNVWFKFKKELKASLKENGYFFFYNYFNESIYVSWKKNNMGR